VASLSQGRTAAAQCGLFTHKSVPVIFEPPCIFRRTIWSPDQNLKARSSLIVRRYATHSSATYGDGCP